MEGMEDRVARLEQALVTLTMPGLMSPLDKGKLEGYPDGPFPAFSARKSADQTGVAVATWTLVTFDVEQYDTNANFASNRFTPTAAGRYQLGASVLFTSGAAGESYYCAIYKNGVLHEARLLQAGAAASLSPYLTVPVVANGTTDYFEVFCWHNAAVAKTVFLNTPYTSFTGYRVL